jgi:WXG100 family type VII secretion target
MSDIIKMDYPSMEDMSATFGSAAETMDDLIRELQTIAGQLEDGVLIGRGGDAFRAGIQDKLVPAVQRLAEKFNELKQDIYGALVDLRDGDSEAESRFKG